MAITETQTEAGSFTGSQTIFASAGAMANDGLLVLTCVMQNANAISSIVQAGATWVKAVDYLNGAGNTRTEIWYAEGIASAGSSITINHSLMFSITGFRITEYAGAATSGALDVVHTGTDAPATNGMIGFNATPVSTTAGQLWVWAVGAPNPGASVFQQSMSYGVLSQNFSSWSLFTLASLNSGIRGFPRGRAQTLSWATGGQVAATFHAADPLPFPDARRTVSNSNGALSGASAFVVGALGAQDGSLLVLGITTPGNFSGAGYMEVTSIVQTDVTWVRAAQHQVGPDDIDGVNNEIWFGTVTGLGAATAAATVNVINTSGGDYYTWNYLELDGLIGNDVSIIDAIDLNTGTTADLGTMDTGLGTLTLGDNRLILVLFGTNHGLQRATGVYNQTNGFNLLRKDEPGPGANRPSNALMDFATAAAGQFQTQLDTIQGTLWSSIMLTLDITAPTLSGIVDVAGNPLAPVTTAQMLGFIEVSAEEALTLKMYNFLLKPIRDADAKTGNLFVKRYLDGPQTVWETTQSKIFALKDLWSITDIDDEHLQFLKNIVGWTEEKITKRVTDALSFDELRRLISISVPFWKTRGPEDTIINILRALTGSRIRIWNWFDFRWVLDETVMTEDHRGRDPWLIDLPDEGDDSHRFNVRIVDPVLPEPLNRDLVINLLKLTRPMGERIEVSYIDFLDRFTIIGDDSQWDLTAGTALVVDGGTLQLSDSGSEEEATISASVVANSVNWTSGIMAYMRARSSSAGVIGMRVLRADALNFYEAQIDVGSFPAPATVIVRKVVAGAPTVIATVSLLQAVVPDEFIGLRVNIEPGAATNQIRVYVDGEEVISVTDPDLTQGSVSVFHSVGADLEADEIEIFETPLVTDTIDINAA